MFDALLRILALTRKELLAILKDPRSRYSLLIPPIFENRQQFLARERENAE